MYYEKSAREEPRELATPQRKKKALMEGFLFSVLFTVCKFTRAFKIVSFPKFEDDGVEDF